MKKPALSHNITVAKYVQKRIPQNSLEDQLRKILQRILTPTRKARGWDCDVQFFDPIANNGTVAYYATFVLACRPQKKRDPKALENEYQNILAVINKAGNSAKWSINEIDDEPFTPEEAADIANRTVGYAEVILPGNWRTNFSHIYDRDEQIDIVISAIRAGIETSFHKRFHVLLYGDPACGKTEIVRSVKKMLGEDACLEYDCTATTAAGAIKDISEGGREEKPRILCLEEAEKVDEASLRWLLGVLDDRAEIRKVNFNVDIRTELRCLTLATVNDIKVFRSMMSGALASRFTHHVYCPRPSEAILRRILEREIGDHGGELDWIDPTLEFCAKHSITDPRKVTAICLCGRDDLMDGSYQIKLAACMEKPTDFSEL